MENAQYFRHCNSDFGELDSYRWLSASKAKKLQLTGQTLAAKISWKGWRGGNTN
jgi:hypothetical protein